LSWPPQAAKGYARRYLIEVSVQSVATIIASFLLGMEMDQVV